MFLNFLADSVSISDNIIKAMANTSLWTAIAKTIIIIFLGFIFTRKKIFPEGTGKVLTKVVMTVALPCLAFTGFMNDFSVAGGVDAIFNFIFGFIIYVFFMFVSKLIFIWVKDSKKRTVLCILFAFGSTTFFAQPLISAIYGAQAYKDSNLLNIAYRVFLYSYAYIVISSLKNNNEEIESETRKAKDENLKIGSLLKKIFLNPIIIATLVGLVLWVLQAIPGVATINKDRLTTNTGVTGQVAFWRVDITLPWIYGVASTLGGLSSPLVWLAIGCTLGKASFKEAATDKLAWIYSVLKVFVAPGIVLIILVIIELIAKACGYPELVSAETVQSSCLMRMVPPATVAVAYCINFDQEKGLASDCSVIGTLVAVPGIVFWVLILTIISSTGFFPTVGA